MDVSKQIANLKKQNEGMETSLRNKNVFFSPLDMSKIIETVDDAQQLDELTKHNNYLKELSKQNRPPPQEKEKQPKQPKEMSAKAEAKADTDTNAKAEAKANEDEEDDIIKEVKPTYSTIANMEDIKRAFFSREYDNFLQLVRQHPFKYYKVNYKYSSDNTGRPAYIAKNLLRGFVQNLDDYRKYLMVCFRCILVDSNTNEYRYPSYWIVNSNDDIKTILGSTYDDYDFISVNDSQAIDKLLEKMKKNEDETDDALVGEMYLH